MTANVLLAVECELAIEQEMDRLEQETAEELEAQLDGGLSDADLREMLQQAEQAEQLVALERHLDGAYMPEEPIDEAHLNELRETLETATRKMLAASEDGDPWEYLLHAEVVEHVTLEIATYHQ